MEELAEDMEEVAMDRLEQVIPSFEYTYIHAFCISYIRPT